MVPAQGNNGGYYPYDYDGDLTVNDLARRGHRREPDKSIILCYNPICIRNACASRLATGQETATVPSDQRVWMCERVISKQGFCFYLRPFDFPSFHSTQAFPLLVANKKGAEMIRKTEDEMKQLESQYPGITEQIWRFEDMSLPACPVCGSTDTASVQVGVIGRTMNIGSATTKFHLMLNGNDKGIYFCNVCRQQFGPSKRVGQ